MLVFFNLPTSITYVATPTLGSWPRQGVTRLRAKRETRESHHMLPGVQKVWGNEPSHSQGNSHVGSWSPKWILKPSERDCKGKKPFPYRVLYNLRKLLKLKCLKWVRIVLLDIWDTSYGQKKGQESNYHNVKQLLSLYFRFYKVIMFENTNATGEGQMRVHF
jgi:hypothetical protein